MEFVKKPTLIFLLLILLTGLGLRVYRLGYQSFWNDELITYQSSSGTPFEIIIDSEDPNIPPLYYLFIKFVLNFGDGLDNREFLMRLPSLVFGSLSILLLFGIINNTFGAKLGFLSAFIMAISPFHIWYSQEARPYALLIFLSLLSFWLLQLLIKGYGYRWLKVAFVLTTASTFYCQTLAIAFIGFLGAYVLLNTPRSRLRDWLIIFGSVILLITPALSLLVLNPPVHSANSFKSFNILSIAYTMWAFCTGYSLGPSLTEVHMPDRMSILVSYLPIILPSMLFFCVLFLVGAVQLRKKNNSIFWSVVLWLVCPLAFAVLGAIFTVHPFNVRYAMLSFPPFIVFITSGILGMNVKWVRYSVLGIIVFISLWSLRNYFFDENYQRENNRAAGRFLTAHALPNDLVIVSAAYIADNLEYYSQNRDLNIIGYPSHIFSNLMKQSKDRSHSNDQEIGAKFSDERKVETDLTFLVADRERFWLYLSRTFHSDPEGHIRKFLDENYNRELYASWAATELILYKNNNIKVQKGIILRDTNQSFLRTNRN